MWNKILRLKKSKAGIYEGERKNSLEKVLKKLSDLRVELKIPMERRFEKIKKNIDLNGLRCMNSYIIIEGRYKNLKFFRLLARLTWFLKTRFLPIIPEIKKSILQQLLFYKEGKDLPVIEVEKNRGRHIILLKYLEQFSRITYGFKDKGFYYFCNQQVVEFCYQVDTECTDVLLKFFIYKHTILPQFYDIYFGAKFYEKEESESGLEKAEQFDIFVKQVKDFYISISELGKPDFINEFLDVVGRELLKETGAFILMQDEDDPERVQDERDFKDIRRKKTYWYDILSLEKGPFNVYDHYLFDLILKNIVFWYEDLEKACFFYQEMLDLDELLNTIFLAEFYDDCPKALEEILRIQQYDLDPVFKTDLLHYTFIPDSLERELALRGISFFEWKKATTPFYSIIEKTSKKFGWDFFEQQQRIFLKTKLLDMELMLKYDLKFDDLFKYCRDDLKIFLKKGFFFYKKHVENADKLIFSQITSLPNTFEDIEEVYEGKPQWFHAESLVKTVFPYGKAVSTRDLVSKFFGIGERKIYEDGTIEKEYREFLYMRTKYWTEFFIKKAINREEEEEEEEEEKVSVFDDEKTVPGDFDKRFKKDFEESDEMEDEVKYYNKKLKDEKKKHIPFIVGLQKPKSKSIFESDLEPIIYENDDETPVISKEEKKKLYDKLYNGIKNYYTVQETMTFEEKKKIYLEKASLDGYLDMIKTLTNPTTPESIEWLRQNYGEIAQYCEDIEKEENK